MDGEELAFLHVSSSNPHDINHSIVNDDVKGDAAGEEDDDEGKREND